VPKIQRRQFPSALDSRFRKFDVQCLACGPYQLRLVAQMDEKAREKAEILKAAGEKTEIGKAECGNPCSSASIRG
jgi:hypothetical protein